MVNHFGGCRKAGGGKTIQRNVLLSNVLNENDALQEPGEPNVYYRLSTVFPGTHLKSIKTVCEKGGTSVSNALHG